MEMKKYPYTFLDEIEVEYKEEIIEEQKAAIDYVLENFSDEERKIFYFRNKDGLDFSLINEKLGVYQNKNYSYKIYCELLKILKSDQNYLECITLGLSQYKKENEIKKDFKKEVMQYFNTNLQDVGELLNKDINEILLHTQINSDVYAVLKENNIYIVKNLIDSLQYGVICAYFNSETISYIVKHLDLMCLSGRVFKERFDFYRLNLNFYNIISNFEETFPISIIKDILEEDIAIQTKHKDNFYNLYNNLEEISKKVLKLYYTNNSLYNISNNLKMPFIYIVKVYLKAIDYLRKQKNTICEGVVTIGNLTEEEISLRKKEVEEYIKGNKIPLYKTCVKTSIVALQLGKRQRTVLTRCNISNLYNVLILIENKKLNNLYGATREICSDIIKSFDIYFRTDIFSKQYDIYSIRRMSYKIGF